MGVNVDDRLCKHEAYNERGYCVACGRLVAIQLPSSPETPAPCLKFEIVKSISVDQGGNQVHVALFARHDNGMIIGGVQDTMAQFGEDVSQVKWLRTYTTHDQAVEALKQKCKEYAGRDDVDFLVTESQDKQLIMPARGPLPQRRM